MSTSAQIVQDASYQESSPTCIKNHRHRAPFNISADPVLNTSTNKMTLEEMEHSKKWIGSGQDRTILHPAVLDSLIEARAEAEADVKKAPYSPARWLDLCALYQDLHFPELASMCAYKAILLIHIICGHKEGKEFLAVDPSLQIRRWALRGLAESSGFSRKQCASNTVYQSILRQIYNDPSFDELLQQAYIALMSSLMACYAFKDAMDISNTAHKFWPNCTDISDILANATEAFINYVIHCRKSFPPKEGEAEEEVYRHSLGSVYRVNYPWLEDKLTSRSATLLHSLNKEFNSISDYCFVKPLFDTGNPKDVGPLGIFASRDVPANTVLFIDESATAVSCLTIAGSSCITQVKQCGNCHASLHPITIPADQVVTAKCCRTSYCSSKCERIAQPYHNLHCGKDLAPLHTYATQTRVRSQSWDPLVVHRILSLIRAHELQSSSHETPPHPLLAPSIAHLTASTPPTTLDIESGKIYGWSFKSHIFLSLHSLLTLGINPFTSFSYSAAGETINTIHARLDNNAAITHSLVISHNPIRVDYLNFDHSKQSSPQSLPWELSGIHPHFVLFNHGCAPSCTWMVAHGFPDLIAATSECSQGNDDYATNAAFRPISMMNGIGEKVSIPVGSNSLVVRTTRAVKKGDELTISYVPEELTTDKKALEKWFGEEGCYCAKCRGTNDANGIAIIEKIIDGVDAIHIEGTADVKEKKTTRSQSKSKARN